VTSGNRHLSIGFHVDEGEGEVGNRCISIEIRPKSTSDNALYPGPSVSFLSWRSSEIFYRSMDIFSLSTGEGDNPNVNEYVSFKICFLYIEYVSFTF
jgi:hypothetical protein